MSIDWTDEMILSIIDDLEDCEYATITAYCEAHGYTPAALRAALSRRGYATPVWYFSPRPSVEVSIQQPDTELAEGNDEGAAVWHVKDGNEVGHYNIVYQGVQYRLGEVEAEYIGYLYTRSEGLGLTATQTAKHLNLTANRYLPLGAINLFIREMNIRKDTRLDLPHHLDTNPLDVADDLRMKREIFKERYERDFSEVIKENLTRRSEIQYEKLNQRFDLLKESLPDDYSRDFTVDTEDKSGYVVRVIPIADLHGGAKVISRDVNHWSSYNKKILVERVDKICNIISQADYSNVDAIHMTFLGDMFEALLGNMRDGQARDMDLLGIDQYRLVRDQISRIINTVYVTVRNISREDIRSMPIPITVICQGGNHDRTTQTKDFDSEELINYILTDRIRQDFIHLDWPIEILVGSRIESLILENGYNLITQHGHLNRLRTTKDVDAFVNIWRRGNCERTIVIEGHRHNFNVLTGLNWRKYICGSIIGDTKFGASKLLVGAPPDFFMLDLTEDGERIIGPYNLR